MNKTRIDWADMTWNPVTGCLQGCEYCYARKIARRFAPKMPDGKPSEIGELHTIGYTNIPFSFGFDPTFHQYRLDAPAKIKKPQTIFVCSMADLFGEWVPYEWIKAVFDSCEAAPQHRYLFLTKNPARYLELYRKKLFPYKRNYWFGTTITTPDDTFISMLETPYHSFVSIEPILARFGPLERGCFPEWIIIGAETGNRKDKVIPRKEWIDDIVAQCREVNVPVFMKSSLREIMGTDFFQEFPWEATP